MPRPDIPKITVHTLRHKKEKGEKIVALTAYDYITASILDSAGVDITLVGDSLGMVLQGHKNTLPVTLDEMIYHTRMVSRAEPRALVVTDMPFHSYHISLEKSVENAVRCVKEGGAEAVKLEGGRKRLPVVEAILNAEIPVMGHVGLTPQSIHMLGGFTVQGKIKEKAREIRDDALALQEAGVFAIILESIPLELAQRITGDLKIPTIGIGAGPHCDGQILVFHDLVGLTHTYLPKFVRTYADLYSLCGDAVRRYGEDIRAGTFPGEKESYHLSGNLDEFFP